MKNHRSKLKQFKNLDGFSTTQIKALFGFHPTILAEILIHVLPELEWQRAARLAQRPERKRAYLEQDGRPRIVTPRDKVLMTLLYLRHNVSHEVVGALFGFSADASEDAFAEVLPVLRTLFPKEKWEAEKRHRGADSKWQPEAVDRIIIDSFETPVTRPSLNDKQKRTFSGKKGQHTIKTQVLSDGKGQVLDIDAGHRGPKADIKLYEESQLTEKLPAPLRGKPIYGDKAYADQKHPEITTPKKKPKGGELTPEEKARNKEISQQRIQVEHGIRRIKGFRILRDQYRMARGIFPTVASAVVGLIHFRSCFA
jgi:DDE superfamily endonuclease/Helix-turn-helix of DDE superfamily endonuclease